MDYAKRKRIAKRALGRRKRPREVPFNERKAMQKGTLPAPP